MLRVTLLVCPVNQATVTIHRRRVILIKNTGVGNLNWCNCGNCVSEKMEIDCMCPQEVYALNSKFNYEDICCVSELKEFEMLFTTEIVF